MDARTRGVAGSRWIALVILTLARTAMGFQFQSIGAVAPLLATRLHIQNAELGLLIGMFSLPGIVLALPGGLLGKRFGDRRVVLWGLALMAGGSGVIGVTEDFVLAAVGRFVSATGSILLNVLLTKMVADWFVGRELIWAMALLINAWPIGIGAALVVLPAVATSYGVGASFHVAAAAPLLGVAAIALLYRDPEARPTGADSRRLLPLARREIAGVSLAAQPWMLYNAAYAVMLGFVPGFLVTAGFTIEEAGLVLGLNTLLLIASVLVGGAVVQWLGRADVIVAFSLLVSGGALLLLPQLPVLPTLILMGLVGGLPAGSFVAAPATVLRAESRGPGLGLFYTWLYLGMTILPPVAGWLQDALGRPTAALYFAGATLPATLVCWGVFRAFTWAQPLRPEG